ncbi:MAG TPA: proline-rich domain-containing protein [Streptosporangiaceae bacterium]|nr:proline-rich domain-containing protein [Streptosporangiaceae bacterium]
MPGSASADSPAQTRTPRDRWPDGGQARPPRGGQDRPWDGGQDRPSRGGYQGRRGELSGGRGGRPQGEGYRGRPQSDAAHISAPASVTADQLDPAARAELRTLPGDLADAVARLLVAAGLEEDAEVGYRYALAARKLAARVGIVRETCGIAAYRAGKWAEALAELRAARRLTGEDGYLPLMADCERALGRLDRALDLVTGPDARKADRQTQIELRIVESGIRRDQGFPEAAVVVLQIPELTDGRHRPGSARLCYAYADALLDTAREEEARYWFGRAAAADTTGETDAAERADDLDQVEFDDLELADDGVEAANDDADQVSE